MNTNFPTLSTRRLPSSSVRDARPSLARMPARALVATHALGRVVPTTKARRIDPRRAKWLEDLRSLAANETWDALTVLVDMPYADVSAALAVAAAKGRAREVKKVLDKHYTVTRGGGAHQESLVHHAFERGAADVAETWAEALSRAGRAAVSYMHADVLDVLLTCGTAIELDDVLLAACCADFGGGGESDESDANRRRARCVSTLLQWGADANCSRCRQGWKPLMACAKRGDVETLKVLIDAGADLDARYFNGKSALFCACEWGKAACAATLIAHGACIEDGQWEADHLYTDHSKTNELVSPRDVAVRLSHVDCVRVIDEALSRS